MGSLIATAAARRVSPVVLELGGKSARVVFEDADMEKVATAAASAILQNAGQTFSAGPRLLVHESMLHELIERIAEIIATVSIGPGIDDHDLGPLISRKQQQRVRHYVETITSGEIVFGGNIAEPAGISGGGYFELALITGVQPTSPIAREDVFGPVLAVVPFNTEDEAILIANGTDYALLAAEWTSDLSRAHRLAKENSASQVYVNTYGAGGSVELPFGGFRSGYGREKGYRGARFLHGYQDGHSAVMPVCAVSSSDFDRCLPLLTSGRYPRTRANHLSQSTDRSCMRGTPRIPRLRGLTRLSEEIVSQIGRALKERFTFGRCILEGHFLKRIPDSDVVE